MPTPSLPVLDPMAAVIDVGSEHLHVSVAGGPPTVFGTTTGQLHQRRDWLKSQGVRSVAMEATGVYWLCPYEVPEQARLPVNWAMAILTGYLWYGQFFFYGFGHFYILKVAGFEQTCWAIHMILLILLGTLIGVVFKERKGCQRRTHTALALAIGLLIVGKLLLDYGNY
jgi:hypothetical protein